MRVVYYAAPIIFPSSRMSATQQTVDVCVIALSDISLDARTRNVCDAVREITNNLLLVTPNWSSERFAHHVEISVEKETRAWKKWMQFYAGGKKLCRTIKAKVWWASDVYSLALAVWCAKQNGGKVLYDSREIYSALGPLSDAPFKQSIVTAIEKRLVRSVTHIVVSGELDAHFLQKHFGLSYTPTVWMNVPPYKEVVQSNVLRERCAIPAESPILLYQGMILHGRGLALAIESLQFLPTAHLCVLGAGEQELFYKQLASTYNHSNRVHFVGAIPYAQLHQWTCSADIGLCFIEPITFSYQLALPNKMFEFAMAALPTLVSKLPAMQTIIKQYPFGELLSTNASAQQCAEAITIMLANTTRYKKQALQVAAQFNQEAQTQELKRLLEQHLLS